jgi:hypothetical protein
MLFLLIGCLSLAPDQAASRKTLGGVDLVELPSRVPGYRTLQIGGFVVLADSRVVEPPETYEKSPLQVLEGELKTIGRIVHAKALAELRKLTIWAEWDEGQALGNGRPGKAVAVYYGGSQRGMLAAGMNPLKANNITVLSTRDLTREHQPGQDSGRCVLLHEMVHAVHHKILGFDNAQIQAAYQQALERGKLERGSYAATNAAEFFAEMSCAYLDKLQYFPRDQVELRKHDPATFQLMVALWSGAESAANRARKADKPDPFELPVLEMKLSEFQPGEAACGPPPPGPGDLEGRVVLVLLFATQSPDALQALGKVAALQAELSELGLTALACHASRTGSVETVRKAAETRAPQLCVCMIPRLARNPGLGKLPHALVFDQQGNLRFSGSAYDAESAARKLVGRMLVEKADLPLEEKQVAQVVGPSVEALKQGDKPSATLARLERLTPTEEAAKTARDALIGAIVSGPKARLTQLQNLQDLDPARVFCEMELMAQRWKGTSIGSLLTLVMGSLRKKAEVQKELRARVLLERVKSIDAQLMRRSGALEPSTPGFRAANADLLNALQQVLGKMESEFTGTPTLAEAERLAGKYQP